MRAMQFVRSVAGRFLAPQGSAPPAKRSVLGLTRLEERENPATLFPGLGFQPGVDVLTQTVSREYASAVDQKAIRFEVPDEWAFGGERLPGLNLSVVYVKGDLKMAVELEPNPLDPAALIVVLGELTFHGQSLPDLFMVSLIHQQFAIDAQIAAADPRIPAGVAPYPAPVDNDRNDDGLPDN